jgi:hypothetical protein
MKLDLTKKLKNMENCSFLADDGKETEENILT